MNHSTPGLPVHHQLLEFTQTHIHRVSDAIQPLEKLRSYIILNEKLMKKGGLLSLFSIHFYYCLTYLHILVIINTKAKNKCSITFLIFLNVDKLLIILGGLEEVLSIQKLLSQKTDSVTTFQDA